MPAQFPLIESAAYLVLEIGGTLLKVSKLGPIAAILNEPGRAETRSVSHVTSQILVLPDRVGLTLPMLD